MKRFLYIFFILFVLLIFNCAPSYAEEEILIIFDASLSMSDTINDIPKYQIASKEINSYIDSLPENTKIGFRTIGMTLDYRIFDVLQNPNYFCEASQLINPIKSNNAFNIKRSLDNIFPLGTTPLTYSLKSAIENDFSYSANPKHIVLITDGAESCDENPCLYAREVMSKRSDIIIDILAINVQTGDIEQLKCITNATGGTTFDIKNSRDIKSALNSIKIGKRKFSSADFKSVIESRKVSENKKYSQDIKSVVESVKMNPQKTNSFSIIENASKPDDTNNGIKYKNYFIEVLK